MLIRLLRLRHPPSSEYAHWSSSLDVPGIEKEGRFQRISSERQKNNEIQKGFALRAPTPLTNISLYTCNGICKQRKAGWTRKAARRRQTEGGGGPLSIAFPFYFVTSSSAGQQAKIRFVNLRIHATPPGKGERDDGNAPHTSGKGSEQPCTYAAHAKKFFSNSKKSSHHSSVMSWREKILCLFLTFQTKKKKRAEPLLACV